jgi:hypothetical protein
MNMRKVFLTGSLLLACLADALSEPPSTQCTSETCKAGTKAVTYFKKADPYYACPSREIAVYVHMVLGLVQLQAIFGGAMPNISDKTGEPEVEGETKAILDSLRAQAHVLTFDEALKTCTIGTNKRQVTVMNMPSESSVAYVYDERSKATFWMPISHLNKIK